MVDAIRYTYQEMKTKLNIISMMEQVSFETIFKLSMRREFHSCGAQDEKALSPYEVQM